MTVTYNLKSDLRMNQESPGFSHGECQHLYRASYIAGKLGFTHTSFKGGHGLWILLPQYYTREFFALYKEYMTLN